MHKARLDPNCSTQDHVTFSTAVRNVSSEGEKVLLSEQNKLCSIILQSLITGSKDINIRLLGKGIQQCSLIVTVMALFLAFNCKKPITDRYFQPSERLI